MGAFPFWAPCRGIRTRKGAELRKREAFASAARKERSDAAGRGRRKGGRGIPPSHINKVLFGPGAPTDGTARPTSDRATISTRE